MSQATASFLGAGSAQRFFDVATVIGLFIFSLYRIIDTISLFYKYTQNYRAALVSKALIKQMLRGDDYRFYLILYHKHSIFCRLAPGMLLTLMMILPILAGSTKLDPRFIYGISGASIAIFVSLLNCDYEFLRSNLMQANRIKSNSGAMPFSTASNNCSRSRQTNGPSLPASQEY